MSITATRDEVADWAARLPPEYLECRGEGSHAWVDRRQKYRRGEGVYDVSWTCARGCGLPRTAVLAADGYWETRPTVSYKDHPEYLSTVGRVGVEGRAVLRLALVGGKGKVRR